MKKVGFRRKRRIDIWTNPFTYLILVSLLGAIVLSITVSIYGIGV